MKEYSNQLNLGSLAEVVSHQDKGDQSTLTTHDNISFLFQPDTVVAFQYFDNLRRWNLFEPEKRLMLAILEDAVNSFQDNVLAESGKAKKLFDEAEEWILEEDNDWIFSFGNICEVLGFDPRYLRLGLLRWKQRQLTNHAKKKPRQSGEITRYAVMGG